MSTKIAQRTAATSASMEEYHDPSDTLTERNKDFAAHRFAADVSLLPTLRTVIIGCADPRVDPAHVLGLSLGRRWCCAISAVASPPATLQTMALLGMIGQVEGARPGSGWNLVVLHHTDCGITRLEKVPDLMAAHFGISMDHLDAKAVADPYTAVAVDVAALKNTPTLPGDFIVSGLVYDVTSGLLTTVVAPTPLRGAGSGA